MATSFGQPSVSWNVAGGVDVSGISVTNVSGGLSNYTIYWSTSTLVNATTKIFNTLTGTYVVNPANSANPPGVIRVPANNFTPGQGPLYFNYTYNTSGGTVYTTRSAASTVLAVITNVSGVTATPNTATGALTVNWTAAAAGATYNVGRNTVNTGTPTIDVSGVSGTTATITPPNGRYYMAVQATFGGTAGAWVYSTAQYYSATTPGAVLPSSFVITTNTAGYTNVAWTAPTVGYSGSLTYAIYDSSSGTGPWTTRGTALASPTYLYTLAQMPTIAAGVPYYIQVIATNGATLTSTVTTAAIIGSVPAVSLTNISDGTISVSWSEISAATNYQLSYSTSSTFVTRTDISGLTASPYIVSGLTLGTLYYFVVQPTFGYGYSGFYKASYSNTRPAANPGAINATVTAKTTTSISFSWPTPTVGYPGALTYTVYTSLNGGAYSNKVATTSVSGANTLYPLTPLTAGSAYSVYFVATNGGSRTSTSNTVSTGTLTLTPTSVAASKASNDSIAISFTPPTTNGLSITSYTVTPYISGVAQTPIIDLGPSSPITLSSLSPGNSYTFTVAAVTSVGTGTASTQTSAIVLPFVATAPSGTSYTDPTSTATYANATLIYTGLAYSDTPVVAQVSPRVWTVTYGGSTDTLTNVKTIRFTDISGLLVDLTYGTYGSLMSHAHTVARAVNVGGDIIYMGAGKFVDYSVGPTLSKSVIVQGVGPGPTILQNSLGGDGPVNTVNITGHNITLKNLTIDNSNLTNYSNSNPGFLLLCVYDPTPAFLPPGQLADPSGNFPPIRNFVCDSCIFTNALTSGLDLSGSYDYNRRGVALNRANNAVIRNCTFPKTYDNGLILTSSNDCKVENSTFYACKGASILVATSNQKGLSYTTTNIDLSDPSNNFIDISAGTYVNSRFGGPIVPTSFINMQPYSNWPATNYFAPFTYGTAGTPDVKIPASMDYVYVSSPTVAPSQSITNRATRKRYTSDQVYLESSINTISWYGYQFSTGNHIIENRFNPIPLLNNLSTATPEGSTVLNPHVIEFQQQSDVLLLTDVSMSAVTNNRVVVIADDVQRSYVYNANVSIAANSGLQNLYIMPKTITSEKPAAPVPVSLTATAYALPQLDTPSVRSQAWFTDTATNYQSLLTNAELQPKTPNNVILTVASNSLSVTWSDTAGGSPTLNYSLTIADTNGNTVYSAVVDSNSATFTAVNGTVYVVTLTASNTYGTSAAYVSEPTLVDTIPDPPTVVNLLTGVSQQMTVSWSKPAGWPATTSFDVEVSVPNSIIHTNVTSPFIVNRLTNGVTYTVTVTAKNPFGTSSTSNSALVGRIADAPAEGNTTIAVGKLTVNWAAPTDTGGPDITAYNVYWTNRSNVTGSVLNLSPADRSYIITGLENEEYDWSVGAVNAFGESLSATATWFTPALIPDAPGTPEVTVSSRELILNWNMSGVSNGGSPILSYNVYNAISNDLIISSSSNSVTILNLVNGTSYSFYVRAVNAIGEGPASTSSVSAVPTEAVILGLEGLLVNYNGEIQSPTVTGVSASETTITCNGSEFIGVAAAGTYSITVALNNPAYSGAPITQTFKINRISLTITARNQSRPYYIPATITSTEFSYSNPVEERFSSYEVTGLAATDSITGVTVSLNSSYNLISTAVTTPNNPYQAVLIPSAASGTRLENYSPITYVPGNLSVFPTLPQPPTDCILTHSLGQLVVSWIPPINNGGVPITAYRMYYGQQDSAFDAADFRAHIPSIDFPINDFNTGSVTEGINDNPYIFVIEAINEVGQGHNTGRYTENTNLNTQNASEQLTRISDVTEGELTETTADLITTVIEAAGTDTYVGLEGLRDGTETLSDTMYAFMEAVAIEQIGGDNLGEPQDITGTDAQAIYEHMKRSREADPDSVTESYLETLKSNIDNNTPIRVTYVKFIIGLDGIQQEPYPIIPPGTSPVPHGIEIKFYIRATSIDDPTQSSLLLITRNADNLITNVEINTDDAISVDGFTIPPGSVGVGAGLTLYVTLASGLVAGTDIPALADVVVTTLPDQPKNVKVERVGFSSNITVSWDKVNDPSIRSYTITPVTRGTPITVDLANIVTNGNTLSTVVTDQSSRSFTVIATNQYGDSAPSDEVAIPCFPAGTRVLTPTGYRTVETLKHGDLVTTAAGLTVPVKVYRRDLKVATERTAPYLIPAHSFGRNAPAANLRLSPLHAFQTKKSVWQIPRFAAEANNNIRQYGLGEPVTYYHLECPNFFRDNLIVDGCVVESFAGKQVPTGLTVYTPNSRIGGYTRVSGPGSTKISHC